MLKFWFENKQNTQTKVMSPKRSLSFVILWKVFSFKISESLNSETKGVSWYYYDLKCTYPPLKTIENLSLEHSYQLSRSTSWPFSTTCVQCPMSHLQSPVRISPLISSLTWKILFLLSLNLKSREHFTILDTSEIWKLISEIVNYIKSLK